MSKALDLLNQHQPFEVPEYIGAVRLHVFNVEDNLPPKAQALINNAPGNLSIRIGGGCAGMDLRDQKDMLDLFRTNLDRYRGLISSGATRSIKDGRIDPMVTEVAALLARIGGENIVSISTVPRIGVLQLVGNSRLEMLRQDEYGQSITYFNPGVATILIPQSSDGIDLGWDGDLETYFQMLEARRNCGIFWNGGGVTKSEIKMSLRHGWDTVLVEGSGRAADELIDAMRIGELDLTLADETNRTMYEPRLHHLHVVSKYDKFGLRDKLREISFLS